ncbi:hypothetical protein ACOMHN_018719 [Nucella lapillus]
MRADAKCGPLLLVVVVVLIVQNIPLTDCLLLSGNTGPHPGDKPQNRTMDPATYWVTFSTHIRPGTKLPVTVRLAKPDVRCNVSVSLRNGSDEAIVFTNTSDIVTSADGSKVIYLNIPTTLKKPSYSSNWFAYHLRVVGTGGITFNESATITLDNKYFSIFVQTDKAKYKPGQSVKFRVLAMNPDLTIRQDPIDIYVRDPEGNGMKHWKGVKGHGSTGVVEKKIPISDQAPVGDWKIDVTIQDYKETKTFTIEKYVLPKFEATLEIPTKVHILKNVVLGTAGAKYTFGKPLTKANVTVTIERDHFYDRYKNRTQPSIEITGLVNKKGTFNFKLYKSKILRLIKENDYYNSKVNMTSEVLIGRVLIVTAKVTDKRSGKTMQTEGKLHFVRDNTTIEFLSITPATYKPGLKYTAQVKVWGIEDNPIVDFKGLKVHFNVTFNIPLPRNATTTTAAPTPTTTVLDMIAHSDKVVKEGSIERPPPRRPYIPQRFQVLYTVMTKPLTANGYVSVVVNVPANATSMTIKAKFSGAQKTRYVQKAESPSDNFMQVQAQVDNPKVGHETTVVVKTTESVNKLYYQLYAKGIMMGESEGKAMDEKRQSFNVTFKVTANMAPNCRILAFYFRKDGEVVVDSLSLKLNTSSEAHVKVSYNKRKAQPGEEIEIKVHTRPDSTVFLLAVDKSVKLLKSGNNITQDMVDEEMMMYGWGDGFTAFWPLVRMCGWPYASGGQDASSVFSEARVAILTDGFVFKKSSRFLYHEGGRVARMRVSTSADYSMDGGGGGGLRNRVPPPLSASSASAATLSARTAFPETWLWDALLIGYMG